MPTFGMRTTSGATGMGAMQAIDPFEMSKTVFSGADPAIADMAGTSGITQGLYPQAANTAIAGSWLSAVTGGPSPSATQSDGGSSTTSDVPQASTVTTVVTFVVAIVLLLAGAFALVGSEASS